MKNSYGKMLGMIMVVISFFYLTPLNFKSNSFIIDLISLIITLIFIYYLFSSLNMFIIFVIPILLSLCVFEFLNLDDGIYIFMLFLIFQFITIIFIAIYGEKFYGFIDSFFNKQNISNNKEFEINISQKSKVPDKLIHKNKTKYLFDLKKIDKVFLDNGQHSKIKNVLDVFYSYINVLELEKIVINENTLPYSKKQIKNALLIITMSSFLFNEQKDYKKYKFLFYSLSKFQPITDNEMKKITKINDIIKFNKLSDEIAKKFDNNEITYNDNYLKLYYLMFDYFKTVSEEKKDLENEFIDFLVDFKIKHILKSKENIFNFLSLLTKNYHNVLDGLENNFQKN